MKHANIAFFVPHSGCPHSCSFCNQKRITGQFEPLTPQKVIQTLENIEVGTLDPEKTELAFFGGSFTAIPREDMIAFLKAADSFRDKGIFAGIRISTRPDCISDDILDILERYNVTAIELGAQSTDDDVLKSNGRGHTAEDIRRASDKIKSRGFSLGLQMMTGLYRSSFDTDVRTCLDIIDMKPDTVRIYPTIVMKDTELEQLCLSGEYIPSALDDTVKLCAKLLRLFHDNGIDVIRMGLHSGGGVDEGRIAGPYHPAFGELCESRLYLDTALTVLGSRQKGSYIITVGDREISKMIGQKRSNIIELQKRGYCCTVEGGSLVPEYGVHIRELTETVK